eukprot:10286427-Lingulodinium_polyedra.AAC.1
MLHEARGGGKNDRQQERPTDQISGLAQRALLIERAAMPIHPRDRTVNSNRDTRGTALVDIGVLRM